MKITRFFTSLFAKKHKRLGLALGSGGAKGFALIGALKAFDEAGIKFDVVAGTSIGSIVGAMYACGFSSREMTNLIAESGVTDITAAKLIMMKLRGESLESFIDGFLCGREFNDTSIPFAAVATNINSGERVVMKNGSLSSALAASSAVPPFRAVERNGVKLVDGAFVDAVPADVVKELGADMIVAVSLTASPSNEGIKSALDAMYKGNKVAAGDRLTEGLKFADFVIRPDLAGFSSTSLAGAEEMAERGYEAALAAIPDIKREMKRRKM